MLNSNEQAAFLESIDRVRESAGHYLNPKRDASAAVNFVVNLLRAVDKVVLQAGSRDPKPGCKPGCAWCCSVLVEATEPEIFLIAREINKLEPAQANSIVETLRKRAANTQGDVTNTHRTGCAFLENNLCSIYEFRPAACRKAHSLSVESCRNFSPEIPQKVEILLGAEALMTGTSDAYNQANLKSSAHELCNAVLLALTDETAESRWYNGEPVFSDA